MAKKMGTSSKKGTLHEAIVPTKENANKRAKPLVITKSGVEEKPRITAIATSGKKKRPRSPEHG